MSLRGLRLDVALRNQRLERYGDWYQDPWGWPEMDYLATHGEDLISERLRSADTWPTTPLRVPKENLGIRPAVVLDPTDRLLYQSLVDQRSVRLIGNQHRSVYGWRLHRVDPTNGEYARNANEYQAYLRSLVHAANTHAGAVATDIVSFFASIPLDSLASHVQHQAPGGENTERLLGLLESWNRNQHIRGLPQRSAASAVLANMYLADVDDALEAQAKQVNGAWSRWMDDIYFFGPNEGVLRATQVAVDERLREIGLALNHSKTDVFLEEKLLAHLRDRDHSAIDSALAITIVTAHSRGEVVARPNFTALEELVEKVLMEGAVASRTSLRFLSSRMRSNEYPFRVEDFLNQMDTFPQASDHLSRLFRHFVRVGRYQDSLRDFVKSDWPQLPWVEANYIAVIPTAHKPQRWVRERLMDEAQRRRPELPLFSLACQRLSEWDPEALREILRDVAPNSDHPAYRRVAAYTALRAGERRATVHKWLDEFPANRVTLRLLEETRFEAPQVTRDYAAGSSEDDH